MGIDRSPWRGFLAFAVFAGIGLSAPAPASGDGEGDRISSVSDLGLTPADIPVSTETKIVYLVNPLLNRPGALEAMLRAPSCEDPVPEGWMPGSFSEPEIQSLVAPARPGDTAAYDAVGDIVEAFFKYTFSQVPFTERTLHEIVQEVNREDFPLAVVDLSPRILLKAGGSGRFLETTLTVRLFMVHVEGDREKNLRWVTRCELCFEDSALGRSPLKAGQSPIAALASSVRDAFKGKIAVSFTHAPALRRPSGKIDEPRRELIGRSISVLAAPSPGAESSSPDEKAEAPEENLPKEDRW